MTKEKNIKKKLSKNSYIFIGMSEVAGYYTNLAQGFRELGYKVAFVGGGAHKFSYHYDGTNDPLLIRFYNIIFKASREEVRPFLVKTALKVLLMLVKQLVFIWAIIFCRFFIFGFGNSFLRNNIDLKFLKFIGKIVVSHIGHGSEARPSYIDGAIIYGKEGNSPSPLELFLSTNRKFKKVQSIVENSKYTISAPLSCQFISKKVVNSLALGVPYVFSLSQNLEYSNEVDFVRILHSPSHPIAKGTPQIRGAINSLLKKGYKIDFVELTNMPNSIVHKHLSKCDFVIDQLFSDTPLAGFATEAASYKKPAIVGGYGWNELKKIVPEEHFPPSLICHPDQVEQAIEKLIIDKTFRENLGQSAYEFVTRNWIASLVAEKFLRIFENNIPDNWLLNPLEIKYISGAGISNIGLREHITELVSQFGMSALHLSTRSDLEQLMSDVLTIKD